MDITVFSYSRKKASPPEYCLRRKMWESLVSAVSLSISRFPTGKNSNSSTFREVSMYLLRIFRIALLFS